MCISKNIKLKTFWVPRKLNDIADYMLKVGAGDLFSFTVQSWVVELLQGMFGKHSIDLFASRNNVQVCPPRYNSMFLEPEAEWLNAFSCDWKWAPRKEERENNWIHPLYAILHQTIRHLMHCKATGTIILPQWEVVSWWPIGNDLLPENQHVFLGQASDVLQFPAGSKYGVENLPRGNILAIRIQGMP